jgi:uncharacterized protein YukE
MTDREAMRMALDALDYVGYVYTTEEENKEVEQAIEALRTALAQPKKEWVGLTGEELQEIYQGGGTVHFKLAMAEEKLKEKNT